MVKSESNNNINNIFRMSLIRTVIFAGLFFFTSGVSMEATAQCNSDSLLVDCSPNLGTYNYIKSFVTTSGHKKKSTEFSYVLSNGSTYLILGCTGKMSEGKINIRLYDRDHNLIASTYDEATGQYFPEIRYSCSSTGLYYITANIEGVRSGCGLCILGFSKN